MMTTKTKLIELITTTPAAIASLEKDELTHAQYGAVFRQAFVDADIFDQVERIFQIDYALKEAHIRGVFSTAVVQSLDDESFPAVGNPVHVLLRFECEGDFLHIFTSNHGSGIVNSLIPVEFLDMHPDEISAGCHTELYERATKNYDLCVALERDKLEKTKELADWICL